MDIVRNIRSPLVWLLLAIMFLSCTCGCATSEEADMSIVLLTDFGTDNYSVAELKGVIYSNHPSARVIDASHDIPAFDVAAAAYVPDVAAKEFPGGSHLLVSSS